MFGEVYDADPVKLAPYVRNTDMNSVLDFTFQSQAVSFAAGNSAKSLQSLFAGDDYYTTPDSSATALPTFLGNHDMGRVGYFLQGTDAPLQRDELAHELHVPHARPARRLLRRRAGLRGHRRRQGAPGRRSSPTPGRRVPEPAARHGRDARHRRPLRHRRPALRAHRRARRRCAPTHPALATGAQIERYADSGAGVYAFSPRRPRPRRSSTSSRRTTRPPRRRSTSRPSRRTRAFAPLYGDGAAVTADAAGVGIRHRAGAGAVVCKADRTVTAPDAAAAISVAAPGRGRRRHRRHARSPPTSTTPPGSETSFAWRVVGADEWHALGTAEDTSPRVFHDTAGLANGTLVEYRAVSTDAAGHRVRGVAPTPPSATP